MSKWTLATLLGWSLLAGGALRAADRWSVEKAKSWYDGVYPVRGCNYLPRTAVNSTEMWQEATFDPATIDEELGWAREAGYDSIRVFLQYVVWKADPDGLVARFRRLLEVAARHRVRVMPVLFCDCSFAGKEPYTGPQADPVPGVHNSGWVPSPGLERVTDRSVWPDLERYVTALVGAFREDTRVLVWDLYNEPGNSRMGERSLPLVEASFAWARAARPTQPITVAAWYDLSSRMSRRLVELSDVVSVHSYEGPAGVRAKIEALAASGRPILSTEWLHRPNGNTFAAILPIFAEHRVGWYQWGLVAGRTQTYMPWGSKPGDPVPALWQHDVFHADGRPYDVEEIDWVRGFPKGPEAGRIPTSDLRIRDPFVVAVAGDDPGGGLYYMVGTGGGRQFRAWRSRDLRSWSGPIPLFRGHAGAGREPFWATRDYWAPEIHRYRGRWYLFGSLKSDDRRRGTQILGADSITGPYAPISRGPATPADRECLDGTLWVEEGQPWMVFCHEWVQIGDGTICALRLSENLQRPVGDPVLLFRASDAPWATELRADGKRVTDGPWLHRMRSGGLRMLWSSFRNGRYALGVARSTSGRLAGPWEQETEPLYSGDGGHAMMFRDLGGKLRLVLHAPNGGGRERARFFDVREADGRLAISPSREGGD